MTIILFILIFGVVVLSHEFGHFIIARKNGIHVVEFSVGMGPTLFHVDKKGTRYSIKLFPIGGACMFEGEDGMEADTLPKTTDQISLQEQNTMKAHGGLENYGGSFLEAGVWARIATIFAGPFFNLALGFIIALILVGFSGTDLPVIQGVMENSAAVDAGISAGDTILKVNGETVHVYREVSLLSALNKTGKPMTITFSHNGQEQTTVLTPKFSEEDNRYYIGLYGGGEYIECKGFDVLKYGYYETQYIFKSTIRSIQMLVTGQLGKNDVSGPVGIASYVGETYDQVKEYGIPSIVLTMMNIILILSVNLGIMNLLPLPALDGGRLVFLFVELVRGKPVPPEKEGVVHLAGLIFFFALMIFVMYNDIMNLIH